VVISFFSVNPITLLLYTQVLNGFLMPILLFLVIRMADDPAVVGEHRSPPLIRLFGWLTLVVLVVFDLLLVAVWLRS
jgi:Mn2+/Fe2+ NRAMP family transporter